jgi:hypothetical protein
MVRCARARTIEFLPFFLPIRARVLQGREKMVVTYTIDLMVTLDLNFRNTERDQHPSET